MDYKSIVYAVSVAQTGSFVRAAKQLSLTQSAVSRAVIGLEKELGIILFDRSVSGATLTPAGQIFMQRARSIVGEMRTLKQEVSQYQTEISGNVAIGASPSLSISHLPLLLSSCIARFPKLQVNLKTDLWCKSSELLRRGAVDFVVESMHGIVDDPDFDLVKVCKFRGAGAFCRPGHPLAGKASVPAKALKTYPFITGGLDKMLIRLYRDLLKIEHDAALHVPLVSENLLALIQVLTATDAVMFTAPEAMTAHVGAGLLVEIPVEYPAPLTKGEVAVVTMKGRTLSTAALHLINQFQKLYQA
jgi:DNA-binding transcriptional LysR family regulator